MRSMSMDTTLGGMAVREYNDYESISGYALAAMHRVVNADSVKGDRNYLSSAESCGRAQIVTMRYRSMGK